MRRVGVGQGVAPVVAAGHERLHEVRPAVLRRGRDHLHALAAGALPGRVGERHPGEAAAVGAAGGHHLLGVHDLVPGGHRVDVGEVGELARQVLVVVDLEQVGVELRLTRRALVGAVHEAARGVGEHHVAARGEPGVVVVPVLGAAAVDRGRLPAASCCPSSSRASSPRAGSRRRASGGWPGPGSDTSASIAMSPGCCRGRARRRRRPWPAGPRRCRRRERRPP